MRGRTLAALGLMAAAGCGQWQKVGSETAPEPTSGFTQMLSAQDFYKRLGRLTAGDPLPFVGSVALVKGNVDTILAVVGLSLENRALAFQKENDAFAARYRVDLTFTPATGRAVVGGQDETVRVPTFEETQRADESILFQKYFKLVPGNWKLTAVVRDAGNGNTSRAEVPLTVTPFGAGSLSAPVLAYQVRDSVIYQDSLRFKGGLPVESHVLRLRPDSMALGEMQLEVGTGPERKSTSAVVSLSTAWLVTNLDEMIDMLRWFRGHDDALNRVKRAPPEDRAEAWSRFWRETDPNAATPENELLNNYFARVAIASQRFRDEGVPGWKTERGEVFIRLGEPDEIYDASAMAQGRVIRWSYMGLRLVLFFHDDSGFGRFRLTPESRAEFERVATRLGA